MTHRCTIVPPWLTDRLPLPDRTEDLAHDARLRDQRASLVATVEFHQSVDGALVIDVFDAQHAQTTTSRLRAVDPDLADAVRGLTATHVLWLALGVQTAPMKAEVHYGRGYDNAFWNGAWMCFGDGDGRYFGRFVALVDVCAHERTHGVTGARLDYAGQAGALNESMSDVAGIVAKQQALGLGVSSPGSWLIGEGLLLEPGGTALRNMLAPGTAYDTPALGRDPQPASFEACDWTITDDDGGVHLYSGVPNRAFALAAMAVGDSLPVLRVWADVLLHGDYPSDCTFARWAQLTVDRAPVELRTLIAGAWSTVGVGVVLAVPPPAPSPAPAPVPAPLPPVQGASFPVAADVVARLARAGAHRRPPLTAEQELDAALRSYFGMPKRA